MGVKRNLSFKTGLQDQLDDVFAANTAQDSITSSLLEKHIPLVRTLSFNNGKETLDLRQSAEKLTPKSRDSAIFRRLYGKGTDKVRTEKPRHQTFIVHEEQLYSNAPIDVNAIPEGRIRIVDGFDEGDESLRREEEMSEKQVKVGNMLPAGDTMMDVESVSKENALHDSELLHVMPVPLSATTSGASYHSAETGSLHSAASQVAHQDSRSHSRLQHDDKQPLQADHSLLGAHLSAPHSHSRSPHHDDENETQPGHPLLGAHLRSTSTILHTPSPQMHPITALSSVKRLEEGVRSRASTNASIESFEGTVILRNRASIDTLHDTVSSIRMARVSSDTPLRKVEQGVSSRASASEGEERREMMLLPRLSFEAPGGWSPVDISDASGRHEDDRAGRQAWEVEEEDRMGGIVRRVSTCAQQ